MFGCKICCRNFPSRGQLITHCCQKISTSASPIELFVGFPNEICDKENSNNNVTVEPYSISPDKSSQNCEKEKISDSFQVGISEDIRTTSTLTTELAGVDITFIESVSYKE